MIEGKSVGRIITSPVVEYSYTACPDKPGYCSLPVNVRVTKSALYVEEIIITT